MSAGGSIGVGVVGTGLSALTFHIPLFGLLTQQFTFLGIVDRRSLQTIREKFPTVKQVSELDELLKIRGIDLIVLCVPNEHHFDLAKRSLEAGKHGRAHTSKIARSDGSISACRLRDADVWIVVVEKPFTVTTQEAEELMKLAKEKNLILAVYHNRRFDGDFLTVQHLIRDNRLGNIVEFESHFDRFRLVRKGNWKDVPGRGVTIVYDLGSHLIDQALVLFGMPHSLTARQLNQRNILPQENSDYFSITLHYPSGFRDRMLPLEVILKGTTLALGPALRYSIKGDRGAFTKYGVDPQEDQLKAGLKPDSVGYGQEDTSAHGTLFSVPFNLNPANVPAPSQEVVETEAGNYLRFYESVAEAISSNDPSKLCIQPEQARDVIRIIELAALSSSESRTVLLD